MLSALFRSRTLYTKTHIQCCWFLVAGCLRLFARDHKQPVTSNQQLIYRNQVSGGHRAEVTPVPIPNTAVKRCIADDTARVTAWESRTPPGYVLKGPQRNLRAFRFSCTYKKPASLAEGSGTPRKSAAAGSLAMFRGSAT